MKYCTSKPETVTSKEYWADKSQDTEWLRGGFLARGAEIEMNQWRLDQVAKLVMDLRHQKRKVFWYRAAFGITVGVLIVRLFT